MSNPKTTDQRQAKEIAEAIIKRLDDLGEHDLASEGQILLRSSSIDWAALLDWNRRACAWLAENWKR